MLIKNVLTEEHHNQLKEIIHNIDKSDLEVQSLYGRLILYPALPDNIVSAINKVVESMSDEEIVFNGSMAVTYSREYGIPNLPPHFDGDDTEQLFNYQIESNTTWPLGSGLELYPLEDNDVLMLQPNKHPHWRLPKEFEDGEYVTMLFLRYVKKDNPVTYDHLRLSMNDPAFDEIYKLIEEYK
jgi:hypothetical protein